MAPSDAEAVLSGLICLFKIDENIGRNTLLIFVIHFEYIRTIRE